MDSDVEVASHEYVTVTYTNHRRETQQRRIHPSRIFYGHSQWHTSPQWLLLAYDGDKKANRTFALNDIRDWKGAP